MADFADRPDHALVDRVVDHVADELAVDLQVIDRQVLEVGKRRQAAAEIIEGELAAEFLQGLHEVHDPRQVRYGGGLGNLETDCAFRQLLCFEFLDHVLEETVLAERSAREVDCDRIPRFALAAAVGQLGKRLVNHPAIQRRHQVVAFRGRNELVRPDQLAFLITHPQ